MDTNIPVSFTEQSMIDTKLRGGEDVAETLLFARDYPAATLSRMVKEGRLIRLSRGVYISSHQDPSIMVMRYWRAIVGYLVPGGVITDRSAVTGGLVDGVLFLAHRGKPKIIRLPSLEVVVRSGSRAQPDDIPLPGGLYQASRQRALLENSIPSRSTRYHVRRTLDQGELDSWIDKLTYLEGAERIRNYQKSLRQLAEKLEISFQNVERLEASISSALGDSLVKTKSQALDARQKGIPYDPDRVRRFEILTYGLSAVGASQSHPAKFDDRRWLSLPFFEAYFSNYIEGTEFTIDEALDVVYENKIPPGRPQDSHDLAGTFQLVSDKVEMSRIASSDPEFVEILRHRHQVIMGGRRDINPGMFKRIQNRVGQSLFVAPDLVEGTLRAGYHLLEQLESPWCRAVMVMFLVSEVHPFDDGNGRLARIMMNSELVAKDEGRIIIPTVFRDDYIGALRRLTRQDDPSVLIKVLRFAHDFTFAIDYSDISTAVTQLSETNAFDEPESPRRLILPKAVFG